MTKIVCIGNTLLTVKAAQQMRQLNPESEIAIFCPEGCLPYDVGRLPELLKSSVNSKETIFVDDAFFKQHHIAVVLDKKISRVYLKRKRVVTPEKEQIPYDLLLIEDQGAMRFSDVKGSHKKGVFHLRTQQDVQQLINDLSLIEVISIEVDSLFLLQIACALREQGKDVLAICPTGHLLSHCLDRHTAQMVTDLLEENGIRVIFNNTITEVLGNGDAKAVRLRSGKVLESQMAVLSEACQEMTLFDIQEAGLVTHKGFSQCEGVIVAEELWTGDDSVVKKDHFEYLTLGIDDHGKMIAQAALGQPFEGRDIFRSLSLNIFGHQLTLLGDIPLQKDKIEYLKSDWSHKIYRKIFIADHKIFGAALFNADGLEQTIRSYIENKIAIDQLSHHPLEEPQCDVTTSIAQREGLPVDNHDVLINEPSDLNQEERSSQQNDAPIAQEIEGNNNIL